MRKQAGATMSGKSVPFATHWYIEPIGKFTNDALVSMLHETRCAPETVCFDGKSRNFWSVTHIEVAYFEESRKIEDRLRFVVWYKDKHSGNVVLWAKYVSLSCRNPRCRLRR